jgi:ubiquinone/menaquinone biosynthesis C-methylase UbiE
VVDDEQLLSELDLQRFWNETARQFGTNGFKAVLNPTSEGIFNWYTDFMHRRALTKHVASFKDKRVLEIGSGIGRWSIRLAQMGAQVTGFDHSSEMIKEAKKNILSNKQTPDIDFVAANARALPFISNSFDKVISVTVLQHIINKKRLSEIAHEIIRVLKTNGQIVLLEIAPKKEESPVLSFPTTYIKPETWIGMFTDNEPITFLAQDGVSLSIFLKPFEYVLKKYSRYSAKLFTQWKPSLRYRILSKCFYFMLSLAIVLSIPFDLLFTKYFPSYSTTKVIVFQKTPVESMRK